MPKFAQRLTILGLLVASLGLLLGCPRKATIPKCTGNSLVILDDLTVCIFSYIEEEPFLLLLEKGDINFDSITLNSDVTEKEVETFSGNRKLSDGSTLEWKCECTPDLKGPLEIDGQSYNLENGGVILIRNDKTIHIKQLSIPEITAIPCLDSETQTKAIQTILESHPEISEFLSGSTPNKE
ncbi:MAG: hypothetical protein PVH19_11260 [Planctomycetia bacterium]|jgi:hypothetical protein